MQKRINFCITSSLSIIAAFLIVLSLTQDSGAQNICALLTCKDAGPENEGLAFNFQESEGMSAVRSFEVLSGGECHETFFSSDNDLQVIEEPTPGFVLEDVVCEGFEGDSIVITKTANGYIAECNLDGEEGSCTFVNVPGSSATDVPALSEWGMIAAAAGLGFVGVWFAVRRRKVQDA